MTLTKLVRELQRLESLLGDVPVYLLNTDSPAKGVAPRAVFEWQKAANGWNVHGNLNNEPADLVVIISGSG